MLGHRIVTVTTVLLAGLALTLLGWSWLIGQAKADPSRCEPMTGMHVARVEIGHWDTPTVCLYRFDDPTKQRAGRTHDGGLIAGPAESTAGDATLFVGVAVSIGAAALAGALLRRPDRTCAEVAER